MLEVNHLSTEFRAASGNLVVGKRKAVRAVDRVSFTLASKKTLGLVGESGSGKSVTALSMMRLIPTHIGSVVEGEVKLEDRDLLKLKERDMCSVRGREMAMIFQDPMSALNPVLSVGSQITEVLRVHQKMSRQEALARAIELLKQVSIPAAESRVHAYPHQLSGGMRQRVLIAMALACTPKVLIADEPTTALDVTVQAQILELLRKTQQEVGMSILLITHDLGVVAEFADDVAVMYAGRVVERASTRTLFASPAHPYTHGLLASLPTFDRQRQSKHKLKTIPGVVPRLDALPKGCRFQSRCERVSAQCIAEDPALRELKDGHWVACHHPYGEVSAAKTDNEVNDG